MALPLPVMDVRLSPPVHGIPPEIISQIFLDCLQEDSSGREIPRLVTKICSSWRHVALTTPMLWTTLRLDLDDPNPEAQAVFVHNWIARSAECPLSIELHDFHASENRAVMGILISSAHRWGKLKLHFGDHLVPVLAPIKGRLTELRELDLAAYLYEDDSPGAIDFFAAAPALRIVKLSGESSAKFELPWLQLTHCEIARFQLRDCLAVLQKATALSSAVLLRMYHSYMEVPIAFHDPTSSNIHSLELIDSVGLDMRLANLTLPFLDTLTVETSAGTHWPHPQLMSFLARSSQHLQKISLKEAPISDSQLLECLEELPSLLELRVEGYPNHSCITDAFLWRMAARPSHIPWVPFLPHVHTLVIAVSRPATDDIVVNMIRSRWKRSRGREVEVAKLQAVTLHYTRRMKPRCIAQLAEYREEGLEFRFIGPP
jgi:hypothetical protein